MILSFFKSKTKLAACTQSMMALKRYSSYSNYSQAVPRHMTGVHLTAFLGLEKTVDTILGDWQEPDAIDSYVRTSLSYAAENGHEAVVKLLLERGVDPYCKERVGHTPLLWAVEHGHETVVQQLLEKDADFESKDEDG